MLKINLLALALTAALLSLSACKKELPETEKAMNAGDLLLTSQRDYQGAREQYAKAIAIDPTYDKAYLAMAQAYEEEDDYKNAAKWYGKFVEVTKSDDMRRQALGWKQDAEHNQELFAKSQKPVDKTPQKNVEETIREEREKAVAAAVAEANEKSQKLLDDSKAEVKNLKREVTELKDQVTLLNEQKESLEKRLTALRDTDDVASLLKTLGTTEVGPELAQQVVKLKNDNTGLATKVRSLDEVNARLREEISSLKARLKSGEADKAQKAELETLRKKYAELATAKAATEAQLQSLRGSTAQALAEAKNSQDSAEKAQALALALADKNAEYAALEKQLSLKDAKIRELETQTANLTLPEGVAAKDISEEITALRKDIASLQKQNVQKDTQITYLRNELNKENGGVTRSEAEIIRRQNAELHQQVLAANEAVKDEKARREEVQKQMTAQAEALRTVPPVPMDSLMEPSGKQPEKVASAFDTPPVDDFQPLPGTAKTAGTTIKTYRSGPIQTVQSTPPAQTTRPAVTKRPKVYQVQRGDTLYGIAQRFYGDSGQWKKILRYNKDELRNANALKVGQRLYIPD
ncbi:LysM peptidoglycan-binding domain-containing protein [bacterium]|nr:LysM peptidoglycan-binding domain-containing protein [bacterium]